METLLIAIAISLATNVDSLTIGVAYSTKSQSIPFFGNLIIALLSGLSTFASMSLGTWACHFLPAAFSQWFGSGLLILIGSLSIIEQLQAIQHPNLLPNKPLATTLIPILTRQLSPRLRTNDQQPRHWRWCRYGSPKYSSG